MSDIESHYQLGGPPKVLCLALCLLFPFSLWASGEKIEWSSRVPLIEKKLEAALSRYQSGSPKEAKTLVSDAYFGIFEAVTANMEVAIRQNISQKKAYEVENAFVEIRRMISTKKEPSLIHSQIKKVLTELKSQAAELDRLKAENP